MNLISLFKSFHAKAIVSKYPPSARVLFDALLFDFNARYWPEHCIYSERALSELTGLSKTTTHEALSYLAQRGHLNVRTSKRQTVIRITDQPTNERPITDQSPTDSRPITDQSPTDSRPMADQPSGLSIARVRKDTDLRQDKDKITSDVARARTDSVDVESRLVTTWRDNNGAPVTAELLSYLSVLVARYGVDRTDEIIRSASDNYGGQFSMTPAFLRKHVQILEGGSKRGKVVDIHQPFKQPDTRRDSEFGL